MAYLTSNPPRMMAQPIAGQRQWQYVSTDAPALVRVTGYFSNAGALGMKAGDLVWVVDSDSSPIQAQLMTVNSIGATYPFPADLTDGTAITATNTD